jgi:flagellar assembly protein FliH
MSERAALSVVTWVPPAIDGPVVNQRSRYSQADLDAIGQQAWAAGFAKGQAAGTAAGVNEQKPHLAALQQQVERFDAILQLLVQPLAELDESVERELAGLACTIARHVVRRELRTDSSQVVAAVRDSVALLPVAARNVRVHLHPDDAAILREKLAEPHSSRAWTIVEDPVLDRGGCRVVTDDSQVDARVESRLGAVIANVLGDQRAALPDASSAGVAP